MDALLVISGSALILITLVDFLFTTLSCNGSGFISTTTNRVLDLLLLPRFKIVRDWSGVIHLTGTLLVWVVLLVLGGWLVFSSHPDMVINSTTKLAANAGERAYYTAFVFSTLGIGDYVPGSSLSRHVTAVYSVLGFGVLTTAITYILSVTGAATKKKNLATFISSMGDNPTDLYAYFTTEPDGSFFTERIDDLVTQLNQHINDHLCYPIVHYFHSDKRPWSAIVQLSSLYECLLALRIRYADDPGVLTHTRRVERCIDRFLELARVPARLRRTDDDTLVNIRREWRGELLGPLIGDTAHSEESRSFGALLRQAGHDWKSVFERDG
ncbi:potassium channel family protein [Lewinella sp. JB7]|uniref:potassium channel family protein n=1 Tax=Lewinella sp. JB7 TaxID=2962887 RepID=UPI0020CA1B0D|nr:potassium channel family protein [Lewinella sp. JB7]MCP9236248.1 potassium channel family protein [Lewinella sp. JB7]